MAQSPADFARKLAKVSRAVKTQQSRAIGARALVTKRFIVGAAASRNRKAKPGWVKYDVKGDTAILRLRGGMAYLTEKGSYKHPEGWDIPDESSENVVLATPYGPKSAVHHPALAARPFWEKGLDASREPGRKAYQKVVNQTITAVLR